MPIFFSCQLPCTESTGFEFTAKAGVVTKSLYWVILKVFSISSVWSSIYAFMISCVTVPTLLQKYPGLQKCCPQYFLFNIGNSSCYIFELLPFKYCIIFIGAIVGGQLTNICTWFFVMFPCIIVIQRAAHPRINNILNLCAIFPFNTSYLYFVVHTMWYCISYWVWLPFLITSSPALWITIILQDNQFVSKL